MNRDLYEVAVDAEYGNLDIRSNADGGFVALTGATGENEHGVWPSFASVCAILHCLPLHNSCQSERNGVFKKET